MISTLNNRHVAPPPRHRYRCRLTLTTLICHLSRCTSFARPANSRPVNFDRSETAVISRYASKIRTFGSRVELWTISSTFCSSHGGCDSVFLLKGTSAFKTKGFQTLITGRRLLSTTWRLRRRNEEDGTRCFFIHGSKRHCFQLYSEKAGKQNWRGLTYHYVATCSKRTNSYHHTLID